MKDQYFGDFGDYQKISLLKQLKDTGFKIYVHWMKTKNDGSTDGKHINYLENPILWKNYEPDIFDYIKQKINKNGRSLKHIEKSLFCKDIYFVNKEIEDTKERDACLKSILDSKSELVFFDPDNGIEVKSTNPKNIHKYITWNEINKTYNSGKSIIIYQHFSRSNRDSFIQNKLHEIKLMTGKQANALKVKHSVYFIISQNSHKNSLDLPLQNFVRKWRPFANLVNAREGSL